MNFKERYKQIDKLNTGKFHKVLKVLDEKDGKYYVLKFIPKEPNENINNLINNCLEEINIMKKIKSEYVVKLIENFYDKSNQGYCIVMELCDSDLRKLLNEYKPKGLPLELIKKIFQQLNDVLKAMLKLDCIHRDLKPENILIKYTDNNKEKFDIKLTDFDLSTRDIKSSIKI